MHDDPEQDKGLYQKYIVKRLRDPQRKHARCKYFVLDLVHDDFAGEALKAYAEACKIRYPNLSEDLKGIINEYQRQ
jgi:hypothetical protein